MPQVTSIADVYRICKAKVASIRFRDMRQLGQCNLDAETLLHMALVNGGVCEGCGCLMLFEGYAPKCWFQFSPDRIDRDEPHSQRNIRLVCLNCNCNGLGARKRACPNGCHTGDPRRKLLPWSSSPAPAPNPADVPLPTFVSDRRAAGKEPPPKRIRLSPAPGCLPRLLEG